MPIEKEKAPFQISVSELAGVTSLRRTDDEPLIGSLAGEARARLGFRVHQSYVARACQRIEGYEGERHVKGTFDVRGQEVVVSGRMDGLYRLDDGTYVVEELKSHLGLHPQLSFAPLPAQVMEACERQLAIYCHLLDRELLFESVIRGELLLIDTLDETVRLRHPISYQRVACEKMILARLETLVARRMEAALLEEHRRRLASELTFPFPEIRPHQQEMMENMAGALDSSLALLVSAPTGIGKTAAALYPAILHCLEHNRRLFYATAKTSQQELALATMERIVPRGFGVVAVQLEARERSCPRDEMLCLPRYCPLLQKTESVMEKACLPDSLMEQGVLRATDLKEAAALHGICPFELSLASVHHADLVVGDFNYVFHPSIHLKRLDEEDRRSVRPRPFVLIVDESHNLYGRALEFLSCSISRKEIRTLAEGALSGASPVYRELLEHLLAIERMFDVHIKELDHGPLVGQGEAVVELDVEAWSEISMKLETWLWDYLSYARSGERRSLPLVPRKKEGSKRIIDPVIDFCLNLNAFARTAERRADYMAPVLYRGEVSDDQTLTIHCLDPSSHLAERHSGFKSLTAMSATLEPVSFYTDVLGLSHRAHASCAFPSPFPEENRLLVADLSVSTRYEDRQSSLPFICQKIASLVQMRPGNHLVFFPSYTTMAQGGALLQAIAIKSKRSFEIAQVSDPSQANALIQRLRTRADSLDRRDPGVVPLAVLTVMGGVLSEGVDFPGNMAISAVVVGPGLPFPSFERQLMLSYHNDRTGSGFEYAYLYPGLNRVIQAAGRVIRSEHDRGVVVLMGERFGQPRYRELLPEYWQKELITTDDSVSAARDFWQRQR